MNGNFYDLLMSPLESLVFKKLRQDLIGNANGKILEVGAGTGVNFQYYKEGLSVIAIEPDMEMRQIALNRANKYIFDIRDGDGQKLDFANESFDTVVATLVFCSIPNPEAAFREVYRVLKPGGRFLLMEHVRKNTLITGYLLDFATPCWCQMAGGCHLNREHDKMIDIVGFKVIKKTMLWSGLGKIWHLQK